MVTLNIKEEFKRLIPPLSKEEYAQLEENCLNEVIRDPIILWNGFIIDGHNRYDIALGNGLPYATMDKEFESEDDVIIWMCNNQLGRRNLAIFVRYELTEQIKEALVRKGKSTQGTRTDLLSIIDNKLPENNTRKVIAEKLNKSTGWVGMADVVAKKAPDALKEKLRTGEVSVNQVYQDIKKEEKKGIKDEQRRILAEEGAKKEISIDFRLGDFEEVFSDIADGSIDCIITDPPYPYDFIEVWSKLSRFAKRVLKPNGYCIAYSGQMYLPEVMQRMSENLDYYWTFAVYHEGNTQIVNGINLMCRWKPVLIFQNGKKKIENTFQDYFVSEHREKNGHDWQQSKSGVAYLIEMFTNEGDTLLEPFAGSGTTIIVARQKNRNILAAEIDEETYNIAKALI